MAPVGTRTSATLWLELTPSCNLHCAFCYNPWRAGPKSAHPETLPHEQYLAALERLVRRRRFAYVALSGGEPLLYPDLASLVASLAGTGQRTILTTNGRLLTRRTLGSLTAAGLNGLQVPLLAATPALHDRLSGRASWEQAVRALALGLEAGISSSATFVATAANLDELPRVAGLLGAIGIRELVVNEMHPEGSARGRSELAPEPSLLREALGRTRELTATSDLRLSFLPAGGGGSSEQASGGSWHRLAVTSDGRLKLCNQSAQTLGSLTDLSDHKLDRLLRDLASGAAAGYRDRVDRCRCFDRAYGARQATQRISVAGRPTAR